MKRFFVFLVEMLWLFAGCKKQCEMKYPNDIKPVIWNEYNDVHTVFWNYYTFCSEAKEEDKDKIIMITGWLSNDLSDLLLVEDISKASIRPMVSIPVISNSTDSSIRIKLDTCDIRKRCYVKGKLFFDCTYGGVCDSKSVPKLFLENADNISFEGIKEEEILSEP